MTDKVHPATKPNATAAAAAASPAPVPPTKAKLQHRCVCLACFWFTFLLLAILIVDSVSAAAFYVLYHPHKPIFSLNSLKIYSLNLTTDDTAHLTTKMNLTISTRNPNKKIASLYGPMSIRVEYYSVKLSNGLPDTVSIIQTTVGTSSQLLETESANSLGMDLKKKKGLLLSIVADTMVAIKIDKSKMKNIGIRVKCVGIRGVFSKGKHVNTTVADVSKAKCNVGPRMKIFT